MLICWNSYEGEFHFIVSRQNLLIFAIYCLFRLKTLVKCWRLSFYWNVILFLQFAIVKTSSLTVVSTKWTIMKIEIMSIKTMSMLYYSSIISCINNYHGKKHYYYCQPRDVHSTVVFYCEFCLHIDRPSCGLLPRQIVRR